MSHVKPQIVDKDMGWRETMRLVREIKHASVTVGIFDDHKVGHDGLTVAEYGAVNEFGTEDGHIPARPFLRPTFDDQRERLVEMGKKLIGAVLERKMDTTQALGILGLSLATAVKKCITGTVPPPNAPSTIAAKGSDKPLIDTGRLLNSISWVVKVND